MIRNLHVVATDTTNPFHNIALEAFLLERVPPETCIFYLWQNQKTVVIGRNQNVWSECHVAALEADGGVLARRLSGGGAVFHDIGNLNFTFLLPQAEYDIDRQSDIILRAIRTLGINAERSGRNDLEVAGRKFSGNAFYYAGGKAYHHGTLLVNADLDAVQKYLAVSDDKMWAKGVISVKSRVMNLAEYNPAITIASLKKSLCECLEDVYQLKSRVFPALDDTAQTRSRLAVLERHFASPDWNYGKNPPFHFEAHARFAWGGVDIRFNVERNVISDIRVFSDAMDEAFIRALSPAMRGVLFTPHAIHELLATRFPDAEHAAYCADIAGLLFESRTIPVAAKPGAAF
jgi:lipoate-protein ligase A